MPPQKMWVLYLGWEDPLEKEMATHSSILGWRFLGTEESGVLQSMGSQRWLSPKAWQMGVCLLPVKCTPNRWTMVQQQKSWKHTFMAVVQSTALLYSVTNLVAIPKGKCGEVEVILITVKK